VEFLFTADPRALGTARAAVRAALIDRSETIVQRAVLVVDELVTDSIMRRLAGSVRVTSTPARACVSRSQMRERFPTWFSAGCAFAAVAAAGPSSTPPPTDGAANRPPPES
jgi:hypothetical protein